MHQSKLQDKNRGMLRDVADDIVSKCERAVPQNEERKSVKAEIDEVLTEAEKSKAVLVTYRDVANINSETVVSRSRNLRILYDYLTVLSSGRVHLNKSSSNKIRPTLS